MLFTDSYLTTSPVFAGCTGSSYEEVEKLPCVQGKDSSPLYLITRESESVWCRHGSSETAQMLFPYIFWERAELGKCDAWLRAMITVYRYLKGINEDLSALKHLSTQFTKDAEEESGEAFLNPRSPETLSLGPGCYNQARERDLGTECRQTFKTVSKWGGDEATKDCGPSDGLHQ